MCSAACSISSGSACMDCRRIFARLALNSVCMSSSAFSLIFSAKREYTSNQNLTFHPIHPHLSAKILTFLPHIMRLSEAFLEPSHSPSPFIPFILTFKSESIDVAWARGTLKTFKTNTLKLLKQHAPKRIFEGVKKEGVAIGRSLLQAAVSG